LPYLRVGPLPGHLIVIEGTDDTAVTERTAWREYEFKGKPGDPARRPPQVADS